MSKFMKVIAVIVLSVVVVCVAGCKKVKQPTVETNQVSNLATTQATVGGFITSDGGGEIIERGVCWGKNTNPDVSANVINAGQGLGSFSCTITGLEPSTTYFARAYAVNNVGVGYGAQVSFTTLSNGGGGGTPENYTVSVSAAPTEGGTVSGGGTFQQEQQCTVKATANTGYTFVNWTENGNQVSDNANYTFTVNGNRTLVANFTAGSYVISASVVPENSGTITGAGGYEYGQSCTLTATANSGYIFANWTEGSNVVSSDASYTFTVSGNRTLKANFTANLQNYTVSVSANPSNGGSVSGGGTYQQGQSCTVSATANNGYTFENWTENNNVVSTNENYTFTVNGNRNIVARFVVRPQAPTGALNGLFSISPTMKVFFSQGNLQYKASTGTWRFAENQWDFCGGRTEGGEYFGNVSGGNNSNMSSTSAYWMDLFGWGTSGWNNGNTYYKPYDHLHDSYGYDTGYGYGPKANNYHSNLTGSCANADWGVYNSISNGGNQVGKWRTLTNDEWVYLLCNRNTASGIRYAKGSVNGVNGIIVLPDDWNPSLFELVDVNGGYYSSNSITAEIWRNLFETNGACFLPDAGHRFKKAFYTKSIYWSSSDYGTGGAGGWAKSVEFNENIEGVHADDYEARYTGCSVRLVCPVE